MRPSRRAASSAAGSVGCGTRASRAPQAGGGGQERQDEDVAVPEHVPSIGRAGQAPSADGSLAMVADRGHQVEQGQPQRLLEPGHLRRRRRRSPSGVPKPHGARRADAETGVLGFVETCATLSKIRTVGDDAIDALVAPRVALGRPEPSLLGVRAILGRSDSGPCARSKAVPGRVRTESCRTLSAPSGRARSWRRRPVWRSSAAASKGSTGSSPAALPIRGRTPRQCPRLVLRRLSPPLPARTRDGRAPGSSCADAAVRDRQE